MKRMALVSILLILMSALAGFAADKGPILIGLQGPITGPWAYEGQMAKQSCEIAAALINQKGGILGGRQIQIVVEDDAGQPRTGALAATKIVGRKGVVASVSTYGSSISEPASNIYEKGKMVNIAYGSTAVRLTEHGLKYFFRTCGRDDNQGQVLCPGFVPQKFGAKRIAIMHDNTAFGKGLAENARDALKPMVDAGKVQIVYYDAITPGEKDFHVPLTKMREAKPDVWYYTGYYAEAALLVTQAREIGITCPFVGGNAAINDEFVKIAGLDMAKGCYMTNEPLPGRPSHQRGGRVPQGLQGQVRRDPLQPVACLRGRRCQHHRVCPERVRRLGRDRACRLPAQQGERSPGDHRQDRIHRQG